jgi:hypothetical protein
MTLDLNAEELDQVIDSLRGQIDCLTVLVPQRPYMQKELVLAKAVLLKAESVMKQGEKECP